MNKKKTKNEISQELDNAKSERDKYLQIAQRAQADLVNLRMKSANELIESELKAHRRMVFQMISVIDVKMQLAHQKIRDNTIRNEIIYIFVINIIGLLFKKIDF